MERLNGDHAGRNATTVIKINKSTVNGVGMVWDVISYARVQPAEMGGGCTTPFMVFSAMCIICEGPKLDP